jgi:hypothetical protein
MEEKNKRLMSEAGVRYWCQKIKSMKRLLSFSWAEDEERLDVVCGLGMM